MKKGQKFGGRFDAKIQLIPEEAKLLVPYLRARAAEQPADSQAYLKRGLIYLADKIAHEAARTGTFIPREDSPLLRSERK